MKSIFYNDERKEEELAKKAPKPKVIEKPQAPVKPSEPVKK